ncbi:MAG: methyltransferase domain-containing protein [Anaerolineae bacterium]
MNGPTAATTGMIELRHVAGTTRSAYNDIYAGGGIQHPARMWEWVLDVLAVRAGHSLLDVACGEAQMVAHAAARGLEAHGVDLSDVALKVGRRRAATASLGLAAANGEALPYPDGTFDYVTNLGSLEHYEDPVRGAAEMARVVADDGIVRLHGPNAFGLRWNVLHAWRHGDVHDDGQPIQRYATRAQWTRVLEAGGLEVVRVLGYEEMAHQPVGLKGWLGAMRHPSRLLVPLAGLLPVDMASIFVFLCRKKPPVRAPLPPRAVASSADAGPMPVAAGAAQWPAVDVEPTVVPAPRGRSAARAATRPPVDPIEIAGIELQYGKGVRRDATIDIAGDAFDDWWRTITDIADRRGEIVLAVRRPDGQILVHTKRHYPLGVWRLPTGGIKPFEAVLDALVRESVEETGHALGVDRFVGLIEHRLVGGPPGRERTLFPSYAFQLREPAGALDVQDSSEGITGFRWVTLDELALLTENLARLGGRYAAWGRFRAVGHELVLAALRG